MDTALLAKALGGLFAIMNPFVALPIFLTLTGGYEVARQRKTAIRVAIDSLVLALVILVGGKAILGFFGVGVDDFRIAGGIVLMTIALGMLSGKGSSAHQGTRAEQGHQAAAAEAQPQADVSFYPMAFPMMVGPGTITVIIVFAGSADGVGGYLAVVIALLVVVAILAGVLWFAPSIGHHMSQTLRVIMTRLMGMILAAIAVEMILTGLAHTFPRWVT